MNRKHIYNSLLALSLILIVLSVILNLVDAQSSIGPYIIPGFVLLAIAVRGFPKIKGFAFSLWVFAAVAVSLSYPQYLVTVGSFQSKKLIIPLLQIIMFGMGSQMSLKDFQGVIKMPKGVIVGIICQFTIMPVVGVTIATLFGFPPEIAAGIVLVGTSPSGLASNVMSFIAKANLALSVTLTAVATILAPLLTPLLMKLLAGQFIEINFWSMMVGIINMVILPIVAGLIFNLFLFGRNSRRGIFIQLASYLVIIVIKNFIFFQANEVSLQEVSVIFLRNIAWFFILPVVLAKLFKYFANGRKDILDKILSLTSMIGIAVIIAVITAAGRDSLLEVGFTLVVACLLHNSFGYLLGYWSCRLLKMDERDCRTIALEVGMQNGGLASGLALQMGKVATVGLAPAVFGPMMNITGSSLASWWRDKRVKGDKVAK
jgi:BASS family bile acid:Na+ symporter